MRRIFHCARFFYLDSSSGAAISNRMFLECLSRQGFVVEALSGPVVEGSPGVYPSGVIAEWDPSCYRAGGGPCGTYVAAMGGFRIASTPHINAHINGVSLVFQDRVLRKNTPTEADEAAEFLSLFESICERFRPDVLVTYGGDPMTLEILARARRDGISTVFTLHNFSYPHRAHFANVNAVLVPSQFSANYHREILGIDCFPLRCLVDPHRVKTDREHSKYITFVNASHEKGVYAFARIAEELGRRRPDIPLLVVESRGTESTLVNCGIDLRPRGNVFLMAQTPDPRDFWRVTHICLMPSLCWESHGMVAVEAMLNGIPVVASDRGALPETLSDSGISLPLPARLTPATRLLPSPEEVTPWLEAIIRLWDDHEWYALQSRKALAVAKQATDPAIETKYKEFFLNL